MIMLQCDVCEKKAPEGTKGFLTIILIEKKNSTLKQKYYNIV